MRKAAIILFMMFAAMFVVANSGVSLFISSVGENEDSLSMTDSTMNSDSAIIDSTSTIPTLADSADIHDNDKIATDSLQSAILRHNKAIDDSLRLDSINKTKKNGIDAPVVYSGTDSLVYLASSKTANIFGDAKVDYQDMKLESEIIRMSLDSSIVYAEGVADTNGVKTGTPVFNMGSEKYESEQMAFNFKTKKGLINNVYTEQEDGFMTATKSKRDSTGVIYMQHGRYTTCDDEHPDFYIALTRAKVRPGKDVVFGPAYLVVADVPLPLALPYGFFPFTSSYSSGFIMPTYGEDSSRGFYLRDGGYYLALSDKVDLKLLGEIYTKGSWGVSAASNYRKRYKFSGSFLFSYQNTINGDKGMPDYQQQTSFKLQWSHRQDAKANPYSNFSASVNFATSSYEKTNLNSMYNPTAMTQSTRTSSVSYSTTFSSIGLSLSSSMNLSQNMRDSSISLKMPDLSISLARFYPFKRKHAAGKERWYEKISMSYTGNISNGIDTKESKLLKSSFTKDWRNGWQHTIPISGSFSLFDVINISPSFNFTDRTYATKTMKSWDEENNREKSDTLTGFYNVYNWNLSLSASTQMYGFFIPNRKLFGDKIQAIRHVFKPTVSFSYAPDFSNPSYGFYDSYTKPDNTVVEYSPFSTNLYGTAPKGKSGSVNLDISNNIEMKIRSDKDTTGFKKISIIDEFGFNMSYNLAAKEHQWSDLSTRLRLKLTKSYTLNLNAVFATYAYELDESGRPYVGNRTEYSFGRFGRFQGISQNISYTLNPEKLKKLFGGKSDDASNDNKKNEDEDDYDTGVESNIDDTMESARNSGRQTHSEKADVDDDGYLIFSMPWSLTFSYGITMRENTAGEFNTKTMRYPYKFTQTLNFNGNINIAQGWNINFTSGYDFEMKKLSMTTASLSRDLHCFSMSCSLVLAPYMSYNFSFRCNAATLTDALKYDKRSGSTNNIKWY